MVRPPRSLFQRSADEYIVIQEARTRFFRVRARNVALDTMQVSQDEGTEEQALAHMERERVRCALVSLPPAQRQVIEFAYYGGLSCSAIARQLGEPLGTVTTRLRLKLLKLREYLHSTE